VFMRTPAKAGLGLALLAASFFVGSWYRGRTAPPASKQASRQILYYACPMHPQYHSDRPGDCPSCGMRLEAVYSGEAGSGALPPGAIRVSAEKQQLLGVRIAEVRKGGGEARVRTVGRVVADEARVHPIKAAVDGWIREVGPATTGSFVRKNEVLASFYSPAFLTPIQSYIYALAAPDPIRLTTTAYQQTMDLLKSLGMSEAQMEELAQTRKPTRDIRIPSPVDGFVVARNVSAGLYFEKGAEFYRVARLDEVWILADLFENEAHLLRPGQTVSVHYQGRIFPAKASEVLPQFDAASRTLKARFVAGNPDYTLRPDMFVEVELPVNLPAAVTVPADAVVDSGLKKTVYVAQGEGYFEPRTVETGWRLGDQVEIVKGLMPGERIVVAGNFLLDSESRMRTVAGPVKDPVCGMEVDPAKAAGQSEHNGRTYYFCSQQCKKDFDKNPQAVLARGTVEEGRR
jgi:Cu(I)/Ag(I) efflux system membrane fusion protein